jgi:hypothetical protein
MEQQEPMVDVELVCDRATKDDCRAGTATVWHGQGDVQPYPKRLWAKLAPHPDVWKLKDPSQISRQAPPTVMDVVEMNKRKEEAAGTNTDMVFVEGVNVTAEMLDMMSDADVRAEGAKRGYDLHPRLNSANLRQRFLDAQNGD